MFVGVIVAISMDQKSIRWYSIKQCRKCISKFVLHSPEMAAPQPSPFYNLVKQQGTGTHSFWETSSRWAEKYSEEGGVCNWTQTILKQFFKITTYCGLFKMIMCKNASEWTQLNSCSSISLMPLGRLAQSSIGIVPWFSCMSVKRIILRLYYGELDIAF